MKTLVLSLFIVITLNASAQINFSGTWQINKSKTNFGAAPDWVLPRVLKVDQQKTQVLVDRTMIIPNAADKHYIETFNVSGDASIATTTGGNSETDHFNWLDDNRGFALNLQVNKPDNQPVMKVTEQWSLSDDQKTLVIIRSVEQADGAKYSITAYFDKQ